MFERTYLEAAAEAGHLDRDDRLAIRECACGRLIDDGNWARCVHCEAQARDWFTPPAEREPERRARRARRVVAALVTVAAVASAAGVGLGAAYWAGGGLG